MSTEADPSAAVPARALLAARVVATISGVQALAVAAFMVFYTAGALRGLSGDPTRTLMSVVMMLPFAAGLVLVSRALWRRSEKARAPALVWNLLLLPVGWSLLQAGMSWVGALLMLTSLTALLGVALMGRGGQSPGQGLGGSPEA